jgi:hypothetical protein
MAVDASLPLQKKIIELLKADAGVAAIVSGRVYDSVPNPLPAFPYLSLGPEQMLTERADEYQGADISVQLDAWSRTPGRVEIKRLARAARELLDDRELTLDEDQRLVSLEHTRTAFLRDPDGLTHHAALTFRARTEPTA